MFQVVAMGILQECSGVQLNSACSNSWMMSSEPFMVIVWFGTSVEFALSTTETFFDCTNPSSYRTWVTLTSITIVR
jgi:hypothetical protein